MSRSSLPLTMTVLIVVILSAISFSPITSLTAQNTGRGRDSQFLAGIGGAGGFRAGVSGLQAGAARSSDREIENENPAAGRANIEDSRPAKAPSIRRGGDFAKLVIASTTIADKSLLIKDIFEENAETMLITMPRRWGKTVNLDMLKRFLEIPVGPDGRKLNRTATLNYKLFTGVGQVGRAPRKMEICNEKLTFLENYEYVTKDALDVLGTFPVIHIVFKDCVASNFDTVKVRVRSTLCRCFQQHKYLESSDLLDEEQRNKIKRYAGASSSISLSEGDIMDGLRFLCDMLHLHYGQNVWILIDEYDAVLNTAYQQFSEDDLEATIDIFTGIYSSALKDNPNLHKGVMTGVLRIAGSGVLSGLNDLVRFDFINPKYARHYGLDEEEMNRFFQHFGVSCKYQAEAKDWYNGYSVTKYNPPIQEMRSQEIIDKYNIWSIVNYLNEREYGELKSYWEESATVTVLKPLLRKSKIRERVDMLAKGEIIKFTRLDKFSANDFQEFKEMAGSNKDVTPYGLRVFLSYLFMCGYLTVHDNGDHYRFPNKEIKHEMDRRLLFCYETVYGIDSDELEASADKLQLIMDMDETRKNDLKALLSDFYNKFKGFIHNAKLVDDKNEEGVFYNEDMVHCFLATIASLTIGKKMGSEVQTPSRDERKKGRADIVITKGNVGVVIELKRMPLSISGKRNLKMDPKDTNNIQHNIVKALIQAIGYQEALNATANKLFIAINIEKDVSRPEERRVELLCASIMFGERDIFGINYLGELDTFGIGHSILDL